jgi:signal transduction histidine kinase
MVAGGILSIIIIGIADIELRQTNTDRIIFERRGTAQGAIDAGTYTLVTEDISIYRSENQKYVIVLRDDTDVPIHASTFDHYLVPITFVTFLLVIVYFTNRVLTRFVFRGIVSPIETLVNGVREIRDGNLEYRIEYSQKDEFEVVCSDFNEMAKRLSDMVSRQQKDETNRRELIAGISHDLRTPLTSIKAYLEGIEKGVATTPQKQEKYIETIMSKTIDLEYIINQLFMFSKLDIGDFPFHLEKTDISKELNHFVDSHKKEYGNKGLSVSISGNIGDLCAEIDVVQFRNVINNVLENSVKYSTSNFPEVAITCRIDGANVEIALTDNGPGVSEEVLENLFDVFYRSDESRNDPSKGSGLGLAISKRIIERFGGRIAAENSDGCGLSIIITLPISKREGQ